MIHQQTLRKDLLFQGIGVHTGAPSSLHLYPACENQGIKFINAQDPEQIILIGKVVPESAMHATVVRNGNWILSTVEHLLAALMMMQVDNVDIVVSGAEIPILDGSSFPFVQGILDVGLEKQNSCKQFLTPKKNLEFCDDKGRFIRIDPLQVDANSSGLCIDYNADFVHCLNGSPILQGVVDQDFFIKEIAPARTFGFLEQLPFLRHHNLAQGTSLGNSVVIGHNELMNDMRLPDECVRHKFLDLIGDLSLLGKMLVGSVKAHKTSHNFNRLVVEHFIKNPDQWLVVE